MSSPPSLDDRCQAIELLVLDVDGVLTDGRIIYADDDTELKQFHVRDGSGIKLWRQAGKRAAVLTGRQSAVVARRAAELGLDPVIQGAADKLAGYRRLLAATGVALDQVCYVGDDLPDVPVLLHCRLAVAVADACPEAKAVAHHVTTTAGGRGAVRETIELILRRQGSWPALVRPYQDQQLDDPLQERP
jgi:3-deoxy-D-manno-octulosonate 8-phosphate phosphatase (KDO 8-P phosphatase)